MRYTALLLLICAFALVACGGGETPAPPTADPNVVDPNATPVPERSTLPPPITLSPREYSTDEVSDPLPVPGTLVAAATPDPDAGLVFDRILFERTGGIAGVPLTIEILSNGSVTRDGQPRTIGADLVTLIDGQLDLMNYFGIQGVFTAPGTSADIYTYNITVERNGASLTVKAQDGFIPPDIQRLISLLQDIGL
ncbi:MAG: hypothetical protein JNJ61_05125 [Anaerolineae bacterium]|nr:hypothetical protein [Anaerolineae bacterium]